MEWAFVLIILSCMTMADESQNISEKTWARAADSISKVGYMDGAADGQKATFQSSFDTGYKQGFTFGLDLGMNEAFLSFQDSKRSAEWQLKDPRRINCQVCIDTTKAQDNIATLCDNQQERNKEYLENLQNAINR